MHSAHGTGSGCGVLQLGAAPGEGGTSQEEEEEGRSRSQCRGSGGEWSTEAMLGAARPPLCITNLHFGAVHFSLTMQHVLLQLIPAMTGRAAC